MKQTTHISGQVEIYNGFELMYIHNQVTFDGANILLRNVCGGRDPLDPSKPYFDSQRIINAAVMLSGFDMPNPPEVLDLETLQQYVQLFSVAQVAQQSTFSYSFSGNGDTVEITAILPPHNNIDLQDYDGIALLSGCEAQQNDGVFRWNAEKTRVFSYAKLSSPIRRSTSQDIRIVWKLKVEVEYICE